MAGEDNRSLREPPESRREIRTAIVLIAAAFLFALLVRGVSAWFCGPAGPQEVRYISIAQGILAGDGFQGIDKRFPDIIQPPLHEFMIAGSLLLLGDPLLAARSLTVVLGSLLVLPVSLLAWRLYGPSTAWRAALLTSVYPLLVHHSGVALTEPIFGLLIVTGVALLQGVASGRPGLRRSAGAGALFGLAFLARPEGLAYLAAGAACLLVLALICLRRGAATALSWTAALVAAFLVFAVPYSAWLNARTGQWRISPKGVTTQVHNLIMTEGIREGWPEREGTAVFYERVKFGLNAEGTDLRSSEIFRSLGLLPADGQPTREISIVGEVLRPSYLVMVVVRNFRTLYVDTLKYGLVLPTLFLGLLFAGIVSARWEAGPVRRSQILLVWFLLAGCSWALSYVQGRFLYPSAALAIPWIARGWLSAEEWARGSFHRPGDGPRRSSLAITAPAAVLLTAAALIHAVPPARLTRNLWRHHQEAGERLRAIAKPGDSVLGLTPVVSFHAGLPFELLPYDTLDRVLAFARIRRVRYVVADPDNFRHQRPQLMDLADPTLAPPDLREVLKAGEGDEGSVIVYELLPESAADRDRIGNAAALHRLPLI